MTSESEKIWEEVRNVKVDLWGLPNQTVEGAVHYLNVPGRDLLVKPKAGAALPQLELALGNKFTITQSASGYLIIARSTNGDQEAIAAELKRLADE